MRDLSEYSCAAAGGPALPLDCNQTPAYALPGEASVNNVRCEEGFARDQRAAHLRSAPAAARLPREADGEHPDAAVSLKVAHQLQPVPNNHHVSSVPSGAPSRSHAPLALPVASSSHVWPTQQSERRLRLHFQSDDEYIPRRSSGHVHYPHVADTRVDLHAVRAYTSRAFTRAKQAQLSRLSMVHHRDFHHSTVIYLVILTNHQIEYFIARWTD